MTPMRSARFACYCLGLVLIASAHAGAQVQFKIVHAFGAETDGEALRSGVAVDEDGSLFGTAAGGGFYGQGMVCELSPGGDGTWTETISHSFGVPHSGDGIDPYGPVTKSLRLYGRRRAVRRRRGIRNLAGNRRDQLAMGPPTDCGLRTSCRQRARRFNLLLPQVACN